MTPVDDVIRLRLDKGEKLLWAGQPVQGLLFTGMDWYLIPFSVVWLAITLVGRYIVDWMRRSATSYGVTDRRAIIISGIFSRSVHSIDFVSLTGLKLEERSDGRGTIYFGDQSPYASYQQWNVTLGRSEQYSVLPRTRSEGGLPDRARRHATGRNSRSVSNQEKLNKP